MESQKKITVSYTDDKDKVHIISILPEQASYHKRWREIKEIAESGRLSAEKRERAYENMEKCIKLFTYQAEKDLPIVCECGCQVMKCHLAKHKVSPKHYKLMDAIENPPAPKPPVAMSNTDIVCECGMIVSKANYARHIKNSRHIKALENKQ
jgi:hypothetical protein